MNLTWQKIGGETVFLVMAMVSAIGWHGHASAIVDRHEDTGVAMFLKGPKHTRISEDMPTLRVGMAPGVEELSVTCATAL